MEIEMLAIGQLAQLSGLTVSALRFYDGAGVLTPAMVDERSGYRWYRPGQVREAQLVARLRRVGLPVPEIVQVLAARSRPAEALAVLDAHLRRLEGGLTDARRELSTARALLEQKETPMTGTTWITLTGTELAAELAAVRFAASSDPELSALCGVLLDVDPAAGLVRLVATDRYRLAVSAVTGSQAEGAAVGAIASSRFVDQAVGLLREHPAEVRLALEADQISLDADGLRLSAQPLAGDYPEYRRLIPAQRGPAITIDVPWLRAQIEAAQPQTMVREQDGETYGLTVLTLAEDGVLTVATGPAAAPGEAGTRIGVNREFLLQALNAGTGGQLLLDLDGPIAPLALRDPQRAESFSLLMPSRLP